MNRIHTFNTGRLYSGPYQIRHTQDDKFVVWSALSGRAIGTQEFYDFEARELAERMNVDYYHDHLEAQS